jgi:hypothetical protein
MACLSIGSHIQGRKARILFVEVSYSLKQFTAAGAPLLILNLPTLMQTPTKTFVVLLMIVPLSGTVQLACLVKKSLTAG